MESRTRRVNREPREAFSRGSRFLGGELEEFRSFRPGFAPTERASLPLYLPDGRLSPAEAARSSRFLCRNHLTVNSSVGERASGTIGLRHRDRAPTVRARAAD